MNVRHCDECWAVSLPKCVLTCHCGVPSGTVMPSLFMASSCMARVVVADFYNSSASVKVGSWHEELEPGHQVEAFMLCTWLVFRQLPSPISALCLAYLMQQGMYLMLVPQESRVTMRSEHQTSMATEKLSMSTSTVHAAQTWAWLWMILLGILSQLTSNYCLATSFIRGVSAWFHPDLCGPAGVHLLLLVSLYSAANVMYLQRIKCWAASSLGQCKLCCNRSHLQC